MPHRGAANVPATDDRTISDLLRPERRSWRAEDSGGRGCAISGQRPVSCADGRTYQLRVVHRDVSPLVWGRLLITSETSIAHVALYLMGRLGWFTVVNLETVLPQYPGSIQCLLVCSMQGTENMGKHGARCLTVKYSATIVRQIPKQMPNDGYSAANAQWQRPRLVHCGNKP